MDRLTQHQVPTLLYLPGLNDKRNGSINNRNTKWQHLGSLHTEGKDVRAVWLDGEKSSRRGVQETGHLHPAQCHKDDRCVIALSFLSLLTAP